MSRSPPKISPIKTGNDHLDRIQEHLAAALNPVLANPALAMRDWRFSESIPTDGTARQLLVQYRGAPTAGNPQGAWVSVFGVNLTAALAVGDLLYASAAGVLSRLPAGSATQVLTLAGSPPVPTWAAGGGGAPTGPAGGVLFGTYPNPSGVTLVGAVSGGGRRIALGVKQLISDSVFTVFGTESLTYNSGNTSGNLANRASVHFATGAVATNSSIAYQASNSSTRALYRPRLVVDMQTGASVLTTRFWFDLYNSTGLNQTAPPLAVTANATRFVGLAYDPAVSANWILASGDGTNMSGVDSGVAVLAATDYTLEVDWSVAGTLTGRINGTAVNKTTNLFTASSTLSLGLELTTTANVAATMDVASFQLDQN